MTPTALALIGLAPTLISVAGWMWSNWLHHKTANTAITAANDQAVSAIQQGANAAVQGIVAAGNLHSSTLKDAASAGAQVALAQAGPALLQAAVAAQAAAMQGPAK